MTKLEEIIDILYYENYINKRISKVVSSHWKAHNKKLVVNKKNNDYEIRSFGIANFTQYSFKSLIKSMPRKIYLKYLTNKYIKDKNIYKKILDISYDRNILVEFDQIKHGIIYNFLQEKINLNSNKYVCIIGDGHGFFGTLIKKMLPQSKIIFVNLGVNLFLDSYYLNKTFSEKDSILINNKNIDKINNNDFIFIEAQNYEIISKLPIFLFVNIASMQEMDMRVINNYFSYIRKNHTALYFYCCNREAKQLPDSSNIIFDNYPWKQSDKVIVEEDCAWYQYYPISKPPFLRKFDGKIKHKLIKISKDNG